MLQETDRICLAEPKDIRKNSSTAGGWGGEGARRKGVGRGEGVDEGKGDGWVGNKTKDKQT